MGAGKGGGGEAAAARKDEQARQAQIRAGTRRINSIFDGGTYGTKQLGEGARFDPNATYYHANGMVWQPPKLSLPAPASRGGGTTIGTTSSPAHDLDYRGDGFVNGAGGGGTSFADMLAKGGATSKFEELVKAGKLFGGRERKTGFGDDFFEGRRQAYIDYATPQLQDQHNDAQRELTFSLDRSGLLDSSVRGQKAGELKKLYDLNKQQIADQALAYESEARNAVEDARSNLVATLNATGDAQGASNSAIARAQALSKPAAYSPLANLFADFTAGLGTQAAMERANYYSGGQVPVRYQTGLFAPKTNAVKVT